jgi:integrase
MAIEIDKLSDMAAKNAKPKDKPYKLADGRGMYLHVMPNGSKYWRLKYRYGGKERAPLALGVYPEVALKDARKARDAARELLASGIDPGDDRRQVKLAKSLSTTNSFEAVALEWLEKQKATWSANYSTKSLLLLQNHLLPWLGHRPILEITPPELLAVLKRVESKGIIETAHRAKQAAGHIFRYAIATGRAERDPTPDLRNALITPTKKHLASITDPNKVGKLLVAMDGFRGTPEVKAALLISALLFQRPGEIRQMKWADIDFEAAEWRYLVTKTNTLHIVPLSRQAIEILRELQPITMRGVYVFPSARGATRPLSENGVRTALRTLGFGNDEITPHGFRAMARTILDEVLGYRVDWIEHQLAHAVKDPNGRAYNRTAHLEGRREMMQGWADYLDSLRAVARGENVVAGNFRAKQ